MNAVPMLVRCSRHQLVPDEAQVTLQMDRRIEMRDVPLPNLLLRSDREGHRLTAMLLIKET